MNLSGSRGFTLIEMVVAFAILALTLTVLYGVFESSLARARHDRQLSEGTLLAESLLERAGTEWSLSDGPRTGTWSNYTYDLTAESPIQRANERAPTVATVRVTARVAWREGAAARQVSLSTLKFSQTVSP